ncbi:hypothetical protein KKC94_04850 [Patescibacteria group bacterium]|nr:hypothetical protein [Patescibacteria group bacterium]
MKKKLTVVMDAELYDLAKDKCNSKFGIGLSPLIKVFLKSFVSQKGVGFFVGDEDLCNLFNRWLYKKGWEQVRKDGIPVPGSRLKDLYDLSEKWLK